MKFFRFTITTLMLVACGDDPEPAPMDTSDGPACTNADYDPCTDNAQCDSNNCKLFMGDGFQVCVPSCTQGGPACPNDSSGSPATCNNMGLCKPAAPNDCTR